MNTNKLSIFERILVTLLIVGIVMSVVPDRFVTIKIIGIAIAMLIVAGIAFYVLIELNRQPIKWLYNAGLTWMVNIIIYCVSGLSTTWGLEKISMLLYGEDRLPLWVYITIFAVLGFFELLPYINWWKNPDRKTE